MKRLQRLMKHNKNPIMENKEKLPWELVEEILSRVPPKPVVRFRTVCKRWNALFDDNTFINNHKLTFRFILLTKAKVYSVSLNPEIEVSELTLDIPGLNNQKPNDLVDCNGLLLCGTKEGAVVCNPWSGQNRCIKAEVSQTSLEFRGIGYDGNRIGKKIVYKTLAFYLNNIRSSTSAWRIHDLATDKWKRVLKEVKGETRPQNVFIMHSTRGVSLNGNLYWVAYCLSHPSLLLVVSFDFGSGKYLNFCGLPCVENDHSDALVLRVFRGDRFSLLKQCHVTKKIQIWVAKDKIDNGHSRDVKWMSFMEVSIPDLPYLVQTQSYHQPSYFIEDKWDGKSLVVCSCDVDGRAWIYVVGESKIISKTRLDSVVDLWPLHCTCFPSLVMVPGCQREHKEKKKKQNYVLIFLPLCFLFGCLGSLSCFLAK
ncbi:putative F-box/kelch-repeat protein At1g32430 [Brassica napus]|uniref:putative F-box/kelch-repeat protein At1g32430 n=1 Tax=Brassica napus TaxID=3708 RepID=UPI0020796BF0|nr:putative F-box/kelch-repeat protein At1g32430 [Brassica napus]